MRNKIKRFFFGESKPDVILIIQSGMRVKAERIGKVAVISTEIPPIKVIYSKDYLTNK